MTSEITWGRRIVVCCDGSWQSAVSTKECEPSNVTKLSRLIARVGTDRHNPAKKFYQMVYYDSGVGTGDLTKLEQLREGGTGAGLAENVIEAYNFIVMNYEPGTEIFCFGFSRGAYTARAVTGLVSDIGVLKPINMQFFTDLYRAYMTNDEGVEFRKSEGWRNFTEGKLNKKGEKLRAKGVHLDPENLRQLAENWEIRPHGELTVTPESRKVKVVGVFDTVGSLGIPDLVGLDLSFMRKKYGFHNVKLTEHVEHAFHAVALDERRKAFRPTLWYIPKELINDPKRRAPELKQVWFPGVHINIGGGSKECYTEMKGDSENISTATFCWMIQCVSPHLAIDQNAYKLYLDQYQRWLFRIRYACTYHHPKIQDTVTNNIPSFTKMPNIPIINSGGPDTDTPKRDPPHEHPEHDFGWGTGPIENSMTAMYQVNGTHTRIPGHEDVETYDEAKQENRWKSLRELGNTNEYIHPIVHHRRLVRGWEPNSPFKKGWNRDHWRGADGQARFWWYMDGEKDKIALPEWTIMPDTEESINFERGWYKRCEKTKKTLDALSAVKDIGKEDFLEVLDRKNDFAFDKSLNQWP